MMRSIVPALAVAALLGSAPMLARADARVGASVPQVVAKAVNGGTIDLRSLRGKVVVVNVWATWCAPCRAEMPLLNAFYQANRSKGVAVVGFSDDRTRATDKVREIMQAFAYPSGLLRAAKVDDLGSPRVLPETFVVDRKGVVRDVLSASGVPLSEAALEKAVAPLL